MATLMVKQGNVEAELFVPEGTVIGEFGKLVEEWEHSSSFTFTEELMSKTKLILDGMEHLWWSLTGMADTQLSLIFDSAVQRVLELPAVQHTVEAQRMLLLELPVVDSSDEPLKALSVQAGINVQERTTAATHTRLLPRARAIPPHAIPPRCCHTCCLLHTLRRSRDCSTLATLATHSILTRSSSFAA